MELVLATISVLERDAHLRRDAAAWAHLHPATEPPEQLPVDLDREPTWQRVLRRLAVRPTPRRRRAHAAPSGVVVPATMTRG